MTAFLIIPVLMLYAGACSLVETHPALTPRQKARGLAWASALLALMVLLGEVA